MDDHLGLALAGLAPDARILSNYLRSQSMNSKLVYDRPLPVSRAVYSIADKAQANTQQYGRRPYGVGLLIVGYDETGPHLYEFQPSGSVLEYYGTAVGARSQAARTYLERSYESFPDATLEQLVVHGLTALRDTLAQDKELTSKNTSVAVVGVDTEFKVIEDDQVAPWLEKLDSTGRSTSQQQSQQQESDGQQPSSDQQQQEGGESMDTSQE